MKLSQQRSSSSMLLKTRLVGPTSFSRSLTVTARAQKVWGARIVSASPLIGDSSTNLQIKVIDAVTDQRTEAFSVDEWDAPMPVIIDNVPGWSRTGTIKVPDTLKQPSGVIVTKHATTEGKPSVDYVTRVELLSPVDGVHKFPAESWVSSEHGERPFFSGTFLPKDTPANLTDDRAEELAMLRGEGGIRSNHRTYDYQPYDDIGPNRPVFKGTEWPLPRRCATKGKGKAFLPYDEQFDYNKQQGFNGDALAGLLSGFAIQTSFTFGFEPNALTAIPFFVAGLANKLAAKKGWQPFNKPVLDEFDDVNKLFKANIKLNPDVAAKVEEVTSLLEVGPLEAAAVGKPYKEQKINPDKKAPGDLAEVSKGDAMKRGIRTLLKEREKRFDLDNLLSFPLPRVEKGRPGAWASDKEFGRQQLAGGNPCDLVALTELPAARGSAITPEHVDAELKQLDPWGRTLQQLVDDAKAGKKPYMFICDYWVMNVLWSVAPTIPNRVEHCGRAIFFLVEDKDGKEVSLEPLAIELATRDTLKGGAGVVYSRHQLRAAKQDILWQLAKAVFRSLENTSLQLHNHWLRSHATQEPYIIALRRNLSVMHPVAKLMLPHFKYLININVNSRNALLAEKGFLESVFTPNVWVTRIGSTLYKLWRFRKQPLPTELKNRGFLDANGKVWLQDFAYAQDGLDIWHAFEEYFGNYLQLYYKSDGEVLADPELQAWWTDVKEKGHEDLTALVTEQFTKQGLTGDKAKAAAEEEIWGFAGPIESVKRLAYVLSTIAWLASAHHAAVNFGVYDYSGYLLNMSPNVRRPIPKPDAVDDPAYKALMNSSGKKQEAEFLSYLASFDETLRLMTSFKVLAEQAENEHTIDEPNPYLTDKAAIELNQEFCNKMKALEMTFVNRNLDPANWTRLKGSPEAMEYTLLYPSSKPATGVTMRGIPYSTTI